MIFLSPLFILDGRGDRFAESFERVSTHKQLDDRLGQRNYLFILDSGGDGVAESLECEHVVRPLLALLVHRQLPVHPVLDDADQMTAE